MKNISIFLNVILFVLVALLYYWHFNDSKTNSNQSTENQTVKPPVENAEKQKLNIVYVNIDTLQAKYGFFVNIQKKLESKYAQLDARLKARETKFQTTFQSFQKKGLEYEKRASVMDQFEMIQAQNDIKQREKELANMEKDYANYKERETKKILDLQEQYQQEFLKRVNNYLAKISQEKGYEYILANAAVGSQILYGAEPFNITKEVLNGLNKIYEAEQTQKK